MDVGALVNDQYNIIEHIGRGGMADVWSARDTRLRRMVAIKTIVSGLSKDMDPVELFKREAHTIAQMEHPHILPIYDFGEYDNNLYIVMRYVTGGSLEDMLRDGPMSPDDVLRMGDAIGQALDYAHTNNVIHLDLKPPNILLDSSGAPYLADFGLATVLDPEGRARNPGSGTLLYMAPEQMMADTIDHRADIYAFCIMLYHMLTGHLPFDGGVPLSMSQIQRGLGLPDLSDTVDNLPHDLSELLRLGTSQEARFRPNTHMEVMDQFRNILQPSGFALGNDTYGDAYSIEVNPYDMMTEVYGDDIKDADLLEAIDIYTRAKYDWQGGQGRFLLGVTNFILMSDYYYNAEKHGLSVDKAGYQVLLRGAIEYDHELDYWWYKLDDDDRRWVCLHALRSGNAPARIRALYRLETLPDEQGTAVIPRLVAQALEIETDNQAKLAALQVLSTRVRLMKTQNVRIKTEFRGRLISSMTRMGIEVAPKEAWRESAYSEDVDILIAEEAFDTSPEIAEAAARTVGRIRSLVALKHLAEQQENKRNGALEALALVRDEAPSLPDVVSTDARIYAWLTNTVRRLTQNPLQLLAEVAFVFVVGWIAMGVHIFGTWPFTFGSLSAQRWTNTLAMGNVFGLLMVCTYMATILISERLRGFWTWWMRLAVTSVLGLGITIISLTSYRFFILQEPLFDVLWDQIRFIAAGLTLGLLASSLLRLKAWQSLLLTTITTFTPIYVIHVAFYNNEAADISWIAAGALIIGLLLGWRTKQINRYETDVPFLRSSSIAGMIGVIIGAVWTGSIWLYYLNILAPLQNIPDASFNYDTVLMLSLLSLLLSFGFAYYSKRSGIITLGIVAIASFAVIYAQSSPQFFDYQFSVPLVSPDFAVTYSEGTPLTPESSQPYLFYRDNPAAEIFAMGLPFVILIAMSMYLPDFIARWWSWIGAERTSKERGAWMYSMLIYVMMMTGAISLLTLYSPQINRAYELTWSFWAFVTFVFAMAAFRWAKWGTTALVISGVLAIFGAIIHDGVTMWHFANQGIFPPLLNQFTRIGDINTGVPIYEYHLWTIWAAVLAIFVWGAQRRALWGGIGLVVLVFAWMLVVFGTSLQGSVAIFAASNVALVLFILQDKYSLMEASRLQFAFPWQSQASMSTPVPETLVNIARADLPPAPATQILPSDAPARQIKADDMRTQVPKIDDLRNLETVDFSNVPDDSSNDLTTQAPIAINPEDLYTSFPQEDEDDEVLTFDDTTPDPMMTNLKVNKPDEDTEDNPPDFKINLDTSALKKQPSTDMETELDPAPTSRGFKVNLDTSALKKPEQEDNQASKPKPVFTFDSSQVVGQNTVQLESEKSEDSEADTQDESSKPSGFKINLDTSALKKQSSNDMETELDPKSAASGFKVNLDTSALKKPKDDDTDDNKPSPRFKFDAADIINNNTVQLDKQDDDSEDDES